MILDKCDCDPLSIQIYYVAQSDPVEGLLDISLDSQIDKNYSVVRDEDGVRISMYQVHIVTLF